MRLIRILLIISLLLFPNFMPAKAQDAASPERKISSMLAYQISLKVQAAAPATSERALKQLEAGGANTGELQSQLVYLYLKKPPDSGQLAELQTMGITPYPDSWIPPVGVHPNGFLLAKTPVNKVTSLAEKTYALKLDTAERLFKPANDLAALKMHADSLWSSNYNGSGIKVAVLDSGIDLGHPDLPVPIGKKDYSNYPTLDDNVANTVTYHGTHVTGSVLGRGTNSAGNKYKGIAPGADLIFLKIGRDSDSAAPSAAMTNAIRDARDVYGADVINISYGGWDAFMDGTDAVGQAVDYAVGRGAVVFVAAGNDASDNQHYSGTVGGNSSTNFIQVNIAGSNGANTGLAFNLVWYDGLGTHNGLSLQYFNQSFGLLATTSFTREESPRGTERQLSYYPPWIPAGNGTYYLKVLNSSPNAQQFHIYFWGQASNGSTVMFQDPDPNYIIGSPASADGSIAVGAYVTRKTWINYKGQTWNSSQTLNTLANFSSRGPRVDSGAPPKPDIIAPGSRVISLLDRALYNSTPGLFADSRLIDNDGLNLDGSGPKDYYVAEGTSMASPVAAGAGALLLQAKPSLKGNPAAVRAILQQTADNYGLYSPNTGYGMLNIQAALSKANNELLPPTVAWVRQFGTSVSDPARSLAVDSSGNLYIAGYTSGAFTGQSSSGGEDIFLRKYSPAGGEIWTRQFGTSNHEEPYSITVDSAGNAYVAGYTLGTFTGQTGSGGDDAFLRKYDASGNEGWTRQFGTSNNEWARAVKADGPGNVYVAGYTWGTFPGQSSSGSQDAFLRKYDSTGSAAWTRQFGTSDKDDIRELAIDSSNNIYAAGYTYATLPGQVSSGGQDAFLRKFDSSGSELWTRQFGTSGEDYARSVALDITGNIFVAGYTSGAFTGQSSLGGQDAFLRKFDSSGNELWTRQFGSSSDDFAYGVKIDSAGNSYVTGYTQGVLPGMTSTGNADIFLRVYNPAGSVAWTRQLGSPGFDAAWSVDLDSQDNSYLAGYTMGALPGQIYLGDRDAFILKFFKSLPSDTVAPNPVTNLASPTHATGTWSNVNVVTVTWTTPVDLGGSGLDGYSILWDQSPGTMPDTIKDIEETASSAFSAALSNANNWYFHIRPVDNAGNWATATHLGPFWINTAALTAPIPSAPANGAVLNSLPTLDWSDVAASQVRYSLMLDKSSDFSSPLLNVSDLASSTYTLSSNVLASTTYYWKARAGDGAGNQSDWSATSSFTLNKTTKFITLSAGWNMMGLPLSPDRVTAGYQFGDDMVSVFLFNYNPSTGVYDTINSSAVLYITQGYWIKMPTETTVDLEGIPTGTGGAFRIQLGAGWNQIGYPFEAPLAMNKVRVLYNNQVVDLNTAHANGWVTRFFYEYDPGNGVYITLNPDTGGTLNPYKGYWVKAGVAALLLIPPPP